MILCPARHLFRTRHLFRNGAAYRRKTFLSPARQGRLAPLTQGAGWARALKCCAGCEITVSRIGDVEDGRPR